MIHTLLLSLLLAAPESPALDLSGGEHPAVEPAPGSSKGERWFERIDLSGFAAAGYYHSGKDGKQKNGRFNAKEATLFFEADAGSDVFAFLEWQALRLGAEETKVAGQTAELYIHFRNVLKALRDDLLGIKIGRFDLPYGEEYLWQDSIDNPLITPSVAWPYGWDEGLLLYGKAGPVGWIASVTDGDDDRSKDEHGAKAYSFKLSGNPLPALTLSGSFLRHSASPRTALEFAGSHIEPVTGSALSQIPSEAFELDASWKGELGHLAVSWGRVFVNDPSELYRRKLIHYFGEALVNFSARLYGVARHSAIGTFDAVKGYHFDGKPFANGNALGYGVRSLSRNSVGVGYRLSHAALIKAELSRDHFRMIDGSTVYRGDRRDLWGVEVAVKF